MTQLLKLNGSSTPYRYERTKEYNKEVRFQQMEPIKLKGIAQKQIAFQPNRGGRKGIRQLQDGTKFVTHVRRTEIDAACRILHSFTRPDADSTSEIQQTGGMMVLTGESGMGKVSLSSLVNRA